MNRYGETRPGEGSSSGQHIIEQRAAGFASYTSQEFREQVGLPTSFPQQYGLDMCVIGLVGQHQQIFTAVVGAVPIAVMDDLTREQRASKKFRSQQPVRECVLTRSSVFPFSVLLSLSASGHRYLQAKVEADPAAPYSPHPLGRPYCRC